MDLITPALIGIGLSMDCFAVSLAIGTTTRTKLLYAAGIIAASFGIFQAGMTLVGWIAGTSLEGYVAGYGSLLAFILLSAIGIKMIWEGLKGEEEGTGEDVIRFWPVIVLSFATSIDALAGGITFGILGSAVLMPAAIIGIIAFLLSFTGVLAGERAKKILGRKVEVAGGIILVLIGIKILLGILPG
jgi:putative Mn2+ efflux pump MntP